MPKLYKFRAKVWIYPGNAAWHFVTLPKKLSAELKKTFAKVKRGWGSLPVRVTVAKVTWETSIFPEKRAGAYLLPIKSQVRKQADILSDDTCSFLITIRA